jgi:ribonucleoside-diphosphate reductase alpha chain
MAHKLEHIQKLLESRYYLRGSDGTLLEDDPVLMFARVAGAVAQAEKTDTEKSYWYHRFLDLMCPISDHDHPKFLPNTPTLINAGKEKGVYAACNVLEVPDSMTGIFDTLKKAAIISKYGGGLGISFSNLREEGAIVKSTGQTSSGPLSFMKVFDAMCDTVKQGGSRRGAMLASLRVDHPDIYKFIELKDDGKSFSNFNMSVVVTDKFMKAVENDESWSLVSPSTGLAVGGFIKAKSLWNKIVEHAWKTGDPGLIFIDEANRKNPFTKPEYEIKTYNACGEQPLLDSESCVLGSINLMAYLKEDWPAPGYTPLKIKFDWDALGEDIPTMVRFLDDIIDSSPYPIKEVEEATKKTRKIGLGIMGWADCLIKMQLPYDSQEALDLAEELMQLINEQAEIASENLAVEKGAFPAWEDSTIDIPRRNAVLTTVAPTGTLSRIAGVSSGIEPNFAWETHHNLEGHEYDEVHWAWEEFDNARTHTGTPLPVYMRTANEISWEGHLKMQAAFQKYVGSSISKTINLPTGATVEDVGFIYGTAWKIGLKGITVYRDKSKENQPLNKIEESPMTKIAGTHSGPAWEAVLECVEEERKKGSSHRKRGPVTVGVTHKVDTGKGKIYMTVNYDEHHHEPVEIFIRLGHAATPTEQALAEFVGRLMSVSLKHGVPSSAIIKQGNKVFSDNGFWYCQKSFSSLPQLICYVLGFSFEGALDKAALDINNFLEEPEETQLELIVDSSGVWCYNCSTYSIIGQGGCQVCTNCGWEKC